jgi:phosphoribosylamine--glycine ligase/phosphoribosylformylglycinamidine cyclo-ligase
MLPRTEDLRDGDVMIALRSSGVHSNGFSLVRKCVERSGLQWTSPCPFEHPGQMPLGEALLTPTKIYVKDVLPLVRGKFIKAMAHITGGGLTENIPRVLPPHLMAEINASCPDWVLPPVFKWLQGVANLPQEEMMRTFNCGVGMVLVVDSVAVPAIMQALFDQDPFLLGTLRSRPEGSAQAVVVGQLA